MSEERLRGLRRAFDHAVGLPPDERRDYLRSVHEDDHELAADVELLLAYDEHSASVFEQMAQDGGIGLRSALETLIEHGFDLSGRQIGAYTLGVVYYELLARRSPYAVDTRAMTHMIRAIAEQEPVPLGVLDRTLRGDLQAIGAKLLDKDRTRRYQSASDLAADVRRFLRHEPVTAQPASLVYQISKAIRRNRVAAGAVVATLLLFVLGVLGTAVGIIHLRTQRDAAQESLTVAEATAQFLDDLLTSLVPLYEYEDSVLSARSSRFAAGPDLLVRDVLEEASRSVDDKFRDRPTVRARVHQQLGSSFHRLGEFERAAEHLAASLRLASDGRPRPTPRTLMSMHDLGFVYLALGRHDEAEQLATRMLAETRAIDDRLGALHALSLLGSVYRAQGRHPDSEDALTNALDGFTHVYGAEHAETIEATNDLAGLYLHMDDRDAGPLLRRALAVRQRTLGPTHPQTLTSLNNWAQHLSDSGELAEAERVFHDVVAGRRASYGDDHPKTFTALNNLGVTILRRGDVGRAAPLLARALEKRRRFLGDDHPETLLSMTNVASVHLRLRQLDDAASLFEVLRDRHLETRGPADPKTVSATAFLGLTRHAQGRYDDAARLFETLIRHSAETLGPEHPRTLQLRVTLAVVWRDQGRVHDARAIITELYEQYERGLGSEHDATHHAAHHLATIRADAGRDAEAAVLMERVVRTRRERLGDRHPRTLESIRGLARIYTHQDRCDESETLLLEALKASRVRGEAIRTLLVTIELSEHHAACGQPDEALAYGRAAFEAAETTLGENDPMWSRVSAALARAHVAHGRDDEARPLMLDALARRRAVHAPEHPETGALLSDLGDLELRDSRLEEAASYLDEADAILSAALSDDHELVIRVRQRRADLAAAAADAGRVSRIRHARDPPENRRNR